MTTFKRFVLCALITSATAIPAAADLFGLGSAANFAVLSGAQLINTADTFVTNGVVGGVVSVSGFPAGIVATSSATTAADTAFNSAYATELALTATFTGSSFAGLPTANTLTPGVYQFSGNQTLPSTLTFDGAGIYVIRIANILTDSSTSFVLKNGATANDILFMAGTSDIEETNFVFDGTIFTAGSAIVDAPGTITGGLFAKGSITIQDLHPNSGATETIDTPSAGSAVPEPTSIVLLLTTVMMLGVLARRQLLRG